MVLLTELARQSHGKKDVAIQPPSSWTVVHNQRSLVSMSGEPPNSLLALSSLNLPSLVSRTPSVVAVKGGMVSRTVPPVRQEASAKPTEEPEDNDRERKITCLPRLYTPHGMNYETTKLLSDLSVEPTPSNAQLFHICKISWDSTEDRLYNSTD
jgi:hypothetical protein